MKDLLFCGVDVHDQFFYAALFNPRNNDVSYFKLKACGKALMNKLSPLNQEYQLKICYEAGRSGFHLHRTLIQQGFNNVVVSPLHIPKTPGKRVKTDRIDSLELAKYYAKDMLTVVNIPAEHDEAVRDLLRARKFLIKQSVQIKNRITCLCQKLDLDFKKATGKKCFWTKLHRFWLQEKLEKLQYSAEKTNLYILIRQLNDILENIELYNTHADEIALQDRYKNKVAALRAFKGIETYSALTLILEIGDIKRFPHPRKLVSYAGLDIAEYSSGGHQKKFGITKMGNRTLRTTLVEACQYALMKPKISRELSDRQMKADEKSVSISKKCMNRLYKKGTRLLYAGKPRNKVKVACAREMIGFRVCRAGARLGTIKRFQF